MEQSKTFDGVLPIQKMTKLKIVSKNNRTHVEDEAGNRLWGVKSIKWEVDEHDVPVCTMVMYGVIADIETVPDIKASPVKHGRTKGPLPIMKGPLPIPRRIFGGKKKVVR